MNDQLQSAVTGLIEKTMKGVDASQDFLTAEIPDFLTQLLLWYGVYMGIKASIAVILFTFAIYLGRKVYSLLQDQEFQDLHVWLIVLSFISTVAGSVLMNLTWLKIMIAPKVWLVEYAATLTGVVK
jgi:hypothetical protein|tara:strand:+ start:3781 stop:4158 length:378 start_codon:yes stop_codon:yes gene_type:complete